MSEITLKIKYTCDSLTHIRDYIKQYNSVFGIVYNYCFEKKDASHKMTKQVQDLLKTKNNIELMDTRFRTSALYDCKDIISKSLDKKIIFGGRKNFFDRLNNKITEDEYKEKRLRPLYMVGDKKQKGNQKFQIIDKNTVLFKPKQKEHFLLQIKASKKYTKYLKKLILKQEERDLPITYRLDLTYVYISFELNEIEKYSKSKKIRNRVFAIDMNPNYIGWSVVDWRNSDNYNLIASGVISLKSLNDYDNNIHVSSDSKEKKYVVNKRNYETFQIAHELSKMANYYRCELFSIEDLHIKSANKKDGIKKHYGKKFRRLVNSQWNRTKLVNTLIKMNDLYGIITEKVVASYSSFIGNLAYRKKRLPDMCLASIEISRRGYEYYHQYELKDSLIKKNIVLNNSIKVRQDIILSLEEMNVSVPFVDLFDLYKKLKETKLSYRFSMEESLSSHSYLRFLYKKKFKENYIFKN